MLDPYIGIVFLAILGVLNAVLVMSLSQLFGAGRPTVVKTSPYESGMVPLGSTRERVPVSFYMVAMLFIVLDVETLFLIPWAVVFRDVGMVGFLHMLVFLSILLIGLVYAWRKGALEWD